MTDRNTAYKTDVSNIAEDDPLAELARIVSGQAPVQPAVQEVAPAAVDDSMDLEAELMRELGGEVEPTQTPAVEVAAPQAESEVQIAPVAEASFEDDLEAQLSNEVMNEPQMDTAQAHVSPEIANTNEDIRAVEPQTNYEPVEAAPSEMLSQLEQQLQDDLKIVDQVTRDVNAGAHDAPAQHVETQRVEETAQAAEVAQQQAPQVDDLDQYFQEQFNEDIELDSQNSMELEQPVQTEAPIEANSNFIPPAPVEVAPVEVAPVEMAATPAIPEPEVDFGDAFAEQVEVVAAEQQLESETELNLEQGFADAFADELNLQAADAEIPAHEPVAASAPAMSIDPAQRPAEASHDDMFAHAEPEFVSDENLDAIAAQQTSGGSGGFKLALGALGIALVAGLGVVGWGAYNNDSTSQEAVIIKADETPVKVKPKDPGGKIIANTENKVYETVSGNGNNQTKQENLINKTQEPVDIAKSAERLKPGDTAQASQQLGGVAPKRVQTLTIRQDGTIVRNAAPKPIEVAKIETPKIVPTAEPITVNGVEVLQPVSNVPENAIIINDNGTTASTTRSIVSNEPKIVKALPVAKAEPVVRKQGLAPVVVAAPVANSNAPTQIAALPKATAPVATVKGWAVQVSSQRSPEAAQQSYANLRKRFSSVLSSREVAVQRANIQGKGTFYRVKIPANSKSDANSLCSRLKSAGGSCFVTRS